MTPAPYDSTCSPLRQLLTHHLQPILTLTETEARTRDLDSMLAAALQACRTDQAGLQAEADELLKDEFRPLSILSWLFLEKDSTQSHYECLSRDSIEMSLARTLNDIPPGQELDHVDVYRFEAQVIDCAHEKGWDELGAEALRQQFHGSTVNFFGRSLRVSQWEELNTLFARLRLDRKIATRDEYGLRSFIVYQPLSLSLVPESVRMKGKSMLGTEIVRGPLYPLSVATVGSSIRMEALQHVLRCKWTPKHEKPFFPGLPPMEKVQLATLTKARACTQGIPEEVILNEIAISILCWFDGSAATRSAPALTILKDMASVQGHGIHADLETVSRDHVAEGAIPWCMARAENDPAFAERALLMYLSDNFFEQLPGRSLLTHLLIAPFLRAGGVDWAALKQYQPEIRHFLLAQGEACSAHLNERLHEAVLIDYATDRLRRFSEIASTSARASAYEVALALEPAKSKFGAWLREFESTLWGELGKLLQTIAPSLRERMPSLASRDDALRLLLRIYDDLGWFRPHSA